MRVTMLRLAMKGMVACRQRVAASRKPDAVHEFLVHAVNRCRFYRERVSAGKGSRLRIDDFPFLTRCDLHDRPADILAVDPESTWTHPFRSSGSTGGWLVVYFDLAAWYGRAFWALDDTARREPGLMASWTQGTTAVVQLTDWAEATNRWYHAPGLQLARVQARRFAYGSSFVTSREDVYAGAGPREERRWITHQENLDTLRYLRSSPPSMLVNRPWGLARLADLDQAHAPDEGRVRPKLVISSGGVLYDDLREHLEGWFGCPIYNRYAITEVGTVAMGRVGCGGLKIAPYVHVSVRTEDGDCADEGTGELVVTSLLNRAMPMIRYRTGDWATVRWVDDEHEGRVQSITALPGRTSPYFTAPGGRFDPDTFGAVLRKLDVRYYQVTQKRDNSFVVRWKQEPAGPTPGVVERTLRAVLGQTYGPLVLRCIAQKDFRAPLGKYTRYINEHTSSVLDH